MQEDAVAIYQVHLDIVSDAVWNRSRRALGRHIDTFVDLVTLDRSYLATPRAQTIDTLIAFRLAMEQVGATAYHRFCLAAAFASGDRIAGRHRTFILRGGNYVIDPYESDMVLVRRGGDWLMGDMSVGRRHLGSASFTEALDGAARRVPRVASPGAASATPPSRTET